MHSFTFSSKYLKDDIFVKKKKQFLFTLCGASYWPDIVLHEFWVLSVRLITAAPIFLMQCH